MAQVKPQGTSLIEECSISSNISPLNLSERIKELNRAIELMGRRGNSIRFDNYSWTQILDVHQSFPGSKIEVYSMVNNENNFYLCLEIDHVVLFSETYQKNE